MMTKIKRTNDIRQMVNKYLTGTDFRAFVYPNFIDEDEKSFAVIYNIDDAYQYLSDKTIVVFTSYNEQIYVSMSDDEYVVVHIDSNGGKYNIIEYVRLLDDLIYDSFNHYDDNEKWLIFETFVMMEQL